MGNFILIPREIWCDELQRGVDMVADLKAGDTQALGTACGTCAGAAAAVARSLAERLSQEERRSQEENE